MHSFQVVMTLSYKRQWTGVPQTCIVMYCNPQRKQWLAHVIEITEREIAAHVALIGRVACHRSMLHVSARETSMSMRIEET